MVVSHRADHIIDTFNDLLSIINLSRHCTENSRAGYCHHNMCYARRSRVRRMLARNFRHCCRCFSDDKRNCRLGTVVRVLYQRSHDDACTEAMTSCA